MAINFGNTTNKYQGSGMSRLSDYKKQQRNPHKDDANVISQIGADTWDTFKQIGQDIGTIRDGDVQNTPTEEMGVVGKTFKRFEATGNQLGDASRNRYGKVVTKDGLMQREGGASQFNLFAHGIGAYGWDTAEGVADVFLGTLKNLAPESWEEGTKEFIQEAMSKGKGKDLADKMIELTETYEYLLENDPVAATKIKGKAGAAAMLLEMLGISHLVKGANVATKGSKNILKQVPKSLKTLPSKVDDVVKKVKPKKKIKLVDDDLLKKLDMQSEKGLVMGKEVEIPVYQKGIVEKGLEIAKPGLDKVDELAGRAISPRTLGKNRSFKLQSLKNARTNAKKFYEYSRAGLIDGPIDTLENSANTLVDSLKTIGKRLGDATSVLDDTVSFDSALLKKMRASLTAKGATESPASSTLKNFLDDIGKKPLTMEELADMKSTYAEVVEGLSRANQMKSKQARMLAEGVDFLRKKQEEIITHRLGSQYAADKEMYTVLSSIGDDMASSALVEGRKAPMTFAERLSWIEGVFAPVDTTKKFIIKNIDEVNERGGAWKRFVELMDRKAVDDYGVQNAAKTKKAAEVANAGKLDDIVKKQEVAKTKPKTKIDKAVEAKQTKVIKKALTDDIAKLSAKTPDSQINKIATTIATDLGIAKSKIKEVAVIIKEYIKKYGSEFKDKIGDMLDDIADRTGARSKLLGGEGAKTVKKKGLAEAKALDGKFDPDVIWKKTGWEKGSDGKWKFEIDDAKASLKTNKLYNILDEAEDLQDILKHDELFKQYPELKDVWVGATDKGGIGSSFDGANIQIDRALLDMGKTKEIKSTLLHEIQHAIQKSEGFARGGNIDSGMILAKNFTKEIDDMNKQLGVLAKANKHAEYEKLMNQKLSKVRQLQNVQDEYGISGYEGYKKLSGEVEARNVQKRLDPKQKKLRPELTEDVPRNKQITSTKNIGVMNSKLDDYKGVHKAPGNDGFNKPAHNLQEMFGGDDIYDPNLAVRYFGHQGRAVDEQSAIIISRLKGKPNAEVTIYRAVPDTANIKDINNGDWITLSKKYATQHGDSNLEKYKILEKKVKAKDIFSDGNSMHEFGYSPSKPKPKNAIRKAVDKKITK